MIQIVTDSTADLGADLARARGLVVVPLLVSMDGCSYRDGLDLSQRALFELVEAQGRLPTTAAPAVEDFAHTFAQAQESVYIGISSRLSSTIEHALLAAEQFPGRVHVVDSLNLSTGIGLLALLAAELRDAGLPAAEIARQVRAAVPRVWTTFVVETMRYLYLGGRCTALQSIAGSLLRIRPAIQVQPDGTMGVRAKLHGPRNKALELMLQDLEANLPRLDGQCVFVTHAACPADAEYLAREVERIAGPRQVLITQAGCVIASHCGPGTVGILYLLRE